MENCTEYIFLDTPGSQRAFKRAVRIANELDKLTPNRAFHLPNWRRRAEEAIGLEAIATLQAMGLDVYPRDDIKRRHIKQLALLLTLAELTLPAAPFGKVGWLHNLALIIPRIITGMAGVNIIRRLLRRYIATQGLAVDEKCPAAVLGNNAENAEPGFVSVDHGFTPELSVDFSNARKHNGKPHTCQNQHKEESLMKLRDLRFNTREVKWLPGDDNIIGKYQGGA